MSEKVTINVICHKCKKQIGLYAGEEFWFIGQPFIFCLSCKNIVEKKKPIMAC